jgi:hypothetical protein
MSDTDSFMNMSSKELTNCKRLLARTRAISREVAREQRKAKAEGTKPDRQVVAARALRNLRRKEVKNAER